MWVVTVNFFKGDVQHGNDELIDNHKEAKESTESKGDLIDSKTFCITSGHNIIGCAVSLYLGFEDSLTGDDTKSEATKYLFSLFLLLRIYGRFRPCYCPIGLIVNIGSCFYIATTLLRT